MDREIQKYLKNNKKQLQEEIDALENYIKEESQRFFFNKPIVNKSLKEEFEKALRNILIKNINKKRNILVELEEKINELEDKHQKDLI